MLFAAGRGARMRPLSDATPKPLLRAGGRALIEWQLLALARAGITEVVVNTAHRGAELVAALGDGRALGVRIAWSHEGPHADDALETAGGIVRALPLLGEQPFLAASGDVVTAFDYRRLFAAAAAVSAGTLDAHLVLVDNPPYHPTGDMGLADGRASRRPPLLNYGNIGVFAPRLFAGLPGTRLRLFPWLYAQVEAGRVGAEHYAGPWFNVGTPADLAALDRLLQGRTPYDLASIAAPGAAGPGAEPVPAADPRPPEAR